MRHLERGISYAVAGLTSTGKTRLVEHTTRHLQDYGYDACCFSVGDCFRHLIGHVQPPYDTSEALITSVHTVLARTKVVVEAGGRVRLVYDDEIVRQTYENGNLSAAICTNGQIIFHVDEFIHDHITGPLAHHDFVGLDGRERRDAQVLFRTTAPPPVRIAIRRIDQPEASASFSNETIMADIAERDRLEFPLLKGIFQDGMNVGEIYRRQANGDSDARIAHQMSGILVDFAHGRMDTNFGTITIAE